MFFYRINTAFIYWSNKYNEYIHYSKSAKKRASYVVIVGDFFLAI